jgi:hypothetical protein
MTENDKEVKLEDLEDSDKFQGILDSIRTKLDTNLDTIRNSQTVSQGHDPILQNIETEINSIKLKGSFKRVIQNHLFSMHQNIIQVSGRVNEIQRARLNEIFNLHHSCIRYICGEIGDEANGYPITLEAPGIADSTLLTKEYYDKALDYAKNYMLRMIVNDAGALIHLESTKQIHEAQRSNDETLLLNSLAQALRDLKNKAYMAHNDLLQRSEHDLIGKIFSARIQSIELIESASPIFASLRDLDEASFFDQLKDIAIDTHHSTEQSLGVINAIYAQYRTQLELGMTKNK